MPIYHGTTPETGAAMPVTNIKPSNILVTMRDGDEPTDVRLLQIIFDAAGVRCSRQTDPAVGRYTIRPHGLSVGREIATLKAFVRI